MAFWYVAPQVPLPPRLMLMTLAGVGLAVMPETEPPEAQVIASAMSASVPPHFPSARTGCTFALKATPVTPLALLETAAIVPATCVPCHELLEPVGWPHSPAAYQSPSSLGLLSRPLPSRAAVASLTKSYPGTTFAVRSLCGVIPVSATATVTPLPVAVSQAVGRFMPASASL